MTLGGLSAADMSPALAGFLVDLSLAGVDVEVGNAPRDYWFVPKEVLPLAAAAPVPVVREERVFPLPVSAPAAVSVVVSAPVVPAYLETWGEPGGVVVVVGGRLAGPAEALVGRMLAAVGLSSLPLGWVGVDGAEVSALVAAVARLQAVRVLVLGKAPLSCLMGEDVGVDAWHHAPKVLPLEAPVGVTYAPEFLLERGAFKQRAWAHLLRWQDLFDPKGDA